MNNSPAASSLVTPLSVSKKRKPPPASSGRNGTLLLVLLLAVIGMFIMVAYVSHLRIGNEFNSAPLFVSNRFHRFSNENLSELVGSFCFSFLLD
jgi:hypothetical protein